MKTNRLLSTVLLGSLILSLCPVAAERIPKPGAVPAVPPADWVAKVRELAPGRPTAPPRAPRKVLVFDLYTGFHHNVIPYVNEVLRVLAEKSGAFELTVSGDIETFAPDRLKAFDGVILNNCCSVGGARDMFLDVLQGKIADPRHRDLGKAYAGLSDDQRKSKAAALEKSLVDHIAAGRGLVGIHGAIVMQNNSAAFSDMLGGSFDYHPRAQELTLYPVDAAHPLLKAFRGEPFIHTDEPYFFSNAYARKNFRPLLQMLASDIQGKQAGKPVDDVLYVSWIKPFGQGRVFYVSPGHFPDTYHSAAMLRFYLDGIQYALGDLPCDDTPLRQP
jgi:type 1 glutamine amidotransferase